MDRDKFIEAMRGGRFRRATWCSDVQPAKRGAPLHVSTAQIRKTTTGTVRGGLDYAHLHGVAECGCKPQKPTAPFAIDENGESLKPFVQVGKDGEDLFRIYRGREARAITSWRLIYTDDNGEHVRTMDSIEASEVLREFLTPTEYARHFEPKPKRRSCPTCGHESDLLTLTFTVKAENVLIIEASDLIG